ncbi:hypothetical protein T05_10034 [Trichinella murrelli]|uniref:Uncharacterized protein n=1 Tax=Trichinella murrelli TaxID=144512 RepID=A0A0V0T891_9BILA|nr:hypothetical protein T05_10034 [Trichinella murrelli]
MEIGGCLSKPVCRCTSHHFVLDSKGLRHQSAKRMFDYCSVHVSTVISHVSQQFRFLVFFIVTQWVVSVQNGLHHQHRARSYSCVNGVTQYRSRNLCGFAYHSKMTALI